MKFKYAFLTLLAGAALAMTGCVEEAPVNDPALAVNVEPSILNFDGKTAGSAQIEVTATASWSTSGVPSWMTVTPPSGSTGTTKVTIAVEAGEEKARSAEVIFKAGQDSKVLTVSQEGGVTYGTLDNPYTCAKAIEFCSTLPDRAKGPKEVYVKGIITRIVEKYGTQYGNATFFMSDDGSADSPEFEVYRAYYFDNKKYDDVTKQNISVGDEVMVYGMIMNYGGQAETSQNEAYLVSLKAGTSPVLSGDVVRAEIMADETEATFTVTAKNLKGKWTVTPKETYSWVTDYTKEGTESGDIVVKVAANTSEEARTAEFTVAADGVSDVILTLTQKGAKVVTTVAGIVEQITSTNSKEPSPYAANLAGAVVSYVNGNNAYIEDASGAILLYLANHGLTAGKKISGPVKGTGYLYNGLPEITAIGADAKIEDGGTIPETTMTIANLVANYQANLSRRIKLVGVTVTDAIADGDRNGVVTQNGAEVKVYAGLNNKGLALAEGATGDLICYPTLYKETKQVSFWDNADWTVGTTPTPQPDGTIKTADELIAWLASPTQDAQLGADIDLTGKTFVSDTLRATFNGNGHKITYSITLESADRQNHYVGLFPQINGTVKNLVTAGKIICNPAHDESEGADNTYFVGGIAAILAPKAIIENCQNGVDVISETQLSHRLGGIVGSAGAGAKISGCKNTGKIEAVIPNKGTGNASQIAGIVGHFEETGSISNCVNDGNILYSALGTVRAAGIVGYINNLVDFTIDGCTNNGNIVSDYLWKSGYTYIGGISGYFGTPTAEGKILYKDCVNNGRIEANGPADGCARPGGIASYGGNSNNPANGNELRFVNCTNNGEIISTSETAKKNPVGGIIGQAEKSAKLILDGCTMNGMVSTNSNYAGGLIGQTGGTESVIKDCVVTDKVVIKAKAAGSAIGLFGGSNAKYTTAVSGKVQGGTIEVAGETTKVTESNYQSLLFGVALGTDGSTSGVSFGK